jgi:hypothetical protein
VANKKKPKKPAGPPDKRPRLSAHPRAVRQINQAKAWGGMVGFALVGALSLQGGSTDVDALTRALLAGIAVYLAAWVLAVVVWRQIARAEVIAAERTWLQTLEDQRARGEIEAQEKAAHRAAERAQTSAL